MERLTERTVDSFGVKRTCLRDPVKKSICDGCKSDCDTCSFKLTVEKLATYEDTGLEPEEIEALRNGMCSGCSIPEIKAERKMELAQADLEGRCVVLPCAPDEIFWQMHGDIPAVSRFDGSCRVDENMNLFYSINGDDVKSSEIGKTVFLTRKEAEAALKEHEQNV